MYRRLLIEGIKEFELKEEFYSDAMNCHLRHSLLVDMIEAISSKNYVRISRYCLYRITPQKMTLLGAVDVDLPIIRTRAKQVSILKGEKNNI